MITATVITLQPIAEAIGVGAAIFLLATPVANWHRRRTGTDGEGTA